MTRVHTAALAFGIFGLFTLLTPIEAKQREPKTAFINPLVVLFPNAGEWNCSEKPTNHWCHRKIKHRR